MKLKFNYKKIGSVMASAAMVGATMGIAAAASYPGAFTAGGADDVAIVSGSGAQQSDFLAAVQIGDNLNAALATSTISGATPTGGDSVAIEKASTKFHIGDGIKTVMSTPITDTNPGTGLPNLLAEGTFTDNDNDEFDYVQKIDMSNFTLTMFENNDYKEDEPSLGSIITSSANVFNYTLDFTDNPLWGDLDTSELPLMGKEYYVLSYAENVSLTLLDSAVTTTLSEGESTTLNVGGISYDISIAFIGTSTVKLDVNGELTNSLAASETQKVATGAYVGVKSIDVQDYAGGIKTVEFSIGSGKVKLTDGSDIEINEDSVSNMVANFSSAESKLQKIILQWNADDDLFIAEDSEITMPVFEAVKVSYTGMNFPAMEIVEVKEGSAEYIQLSNFPLKDSVEDINILYRNSSGTGYRGIGKDDDNQLATNGTFLTFSAYAHDYFVASWSDGNDAESYLMRALSFSDTNGVNKTKFEYKKNKAWADAGTKKAAEVVTLGSMEFTVTGQPDKTARQVNITAGSNVNFNTLYSKEGLKVYLPFNGSAAYLNTFVSRGHFNDTNATFELVFQEEDKDGNIGSGKEFNLTLGFNSATTPEVSITGISYADRSGTSTEILETDVFRNFVYGPLATEILWNKPSGGQNGVTLTYHGEESWGNFFVSSQETVFSGGASGATVISVKDTEAASVSEKNLIVVGGSCINTVAQELLGASAPLCESDFTAATGVGENEFLVQTFARSGGKVATLVAGYQAADTTNAANALTTKTPTIEAGVKYEGDNTGRFETVA
tara:strand:+ start:2252 stop:4594 length:2343 start_codon:yes stop_codon:yes gene_type:complete